MNSIVQSRQDAPRHLLVAGYSHAQVPLAIREKYSLTPAQQGALLGEIHHCPPLAELVVLNTCNRLELFVVSTRADWSPAYCLGHIYRMIWPDMPRADFDTLLATSHLHVDGEGVRHLFRTTASLDSMVVGEAEINGQVKAAYQAARAAGTAGPVLNRLFQNAFSVAKRVRSETEIGRGLVSVGTVAVQEALDLRQGQRSAGRALICGAGQMATTLARHLRKKSDTDIVVVNRSRDRAEQLAAEVAGQAASLDQLPELVAGADMVFGAMGGGDYLVSCDVLAPAAHRPLGHPLIVVDVSVPRCIAPGARTMPGVCLVDMDDLGRRVSASQQRRRCELQRAEQMVTEGVAEHLPRLLFAMGRGELPGVGTTHRRGYSAGLPSPVSIS